MQTFFKIGVLKNFAIFTGKHLCWSLFLILFFKTKRKAFRCFPVNIAKLLRAAFFIGHFRWLLLVDDLFGIIFSKRRCWICCSYTLHNYFVLKPKVTLIRFIYFHLLYHLLSFLFTRCYSLSLVVLLVVIRCATHYCHSLSFAITCCATRWHSMYHTSVFL